MQKVDFTVDGLKHVCETCWSRIDDFRQFSVHVESIHISYVRHFLKDDGTFNNADDVSMFYVQVDDIHNLYAKQLLNNGGDDKKFDYIEPFCVINVDENDTVEIKNGLHNASASVNDASAESDQLSPSATTTTTNIKIETDCKDVKMETRCTSNSTNELMSGDGGSDDGGMNDDNDDVESEDAASDWSEEDKKPMPNKAIRKKAKKTSKSSDVGGSSKKKNKFFKTGLDFFSSTDERNILLLKYVQLKCDLCSDRTFRSFSDVHRHYWDEHEQNGYVMCCNRKFRRLARILQHCRWHENPEAFK